MGISLWQRVDEAARVGWAELSIRGICCRYQQIMHYHMQNEEYGKVIEACKRYGDQEGCLWEQALGYFARKEEDCKAYISEVLHHIDQNNLMPPLLGEQLGVTACRLCFLVDFDHCDYNSNEQQAANNRKRCRF